MTKAHNLAGLTGALLALSGCSHFNTAAVPAGSGHSLAATADCLTGGCMLKFPVTLTEPLPSGAKTYSLPGGGILLTTNKIARGPITEFGVWLGAKSDPSSFHASLGGQDITGQFYPAPAQDAGSLAPQGSFLIAQADNASAANPPYSYSLTVSANCKADVKNCGPTTRRVTFVPPQLVMNTDGASHYLVSSPLALRAGVPTNIDIAVQNAPPRPISVTLSEHLDGAVNGGNPILSLNGAAPAGAITVIIPAHHNWTNFTVTASKAGSFSVDSQAPGCVVVPLHGTAQ